jgi:hypothetical protein
VCARSLESPGPDLLRKFGGGAHGFFALQGCTLIASPRDPLTYGIQRWRSGADEGIRVASHSGHQDLPVTRYIPDLSPCTSRPDHAVISSLFSRGHAKATLAVPVLTVVLCMLM